MKLLQAFLILSAAVGGLFLAAPARAEPVYPYCLIGTPNLGRDCTFSSLQQCQDSAQPGLGFCMDNPAFTVLRRGVPEPARR